MRLVALFLILLATAGCDQATKHLARTRLPLAESVTLPGHFMHLALAENPGAFLSLGASLSEVARNGVFTLGVALGLSLLLVYLSSRTPGVDWLSFAGLALVWAGGTKRQSLGPADKARFGHGFHGGSGRPFSYGGF